MNSKSAIPWIFVLIFAVAAGVCFTTVKSHERELAQLRQENSELVELRAEAEQARKEPANSNPAQGEIERQELIRLRNEVGVLRREKQSLTTQFQQAKKSQERLENQQALLQQQTQNLVQQTQQTEQQIQSDKARNACINNLRQIDGAKQQWALENKQPADALVVAQQIEPFLSGAKLPVCPSGGVYTIGVVDAAPTCSIPGHALP